MHAELFSEISKIAKSIKKEKRILVVSHYDADGLSAAGIIFNTLEALGKDFEVKIVKQLYAEEIEEIKADDSFKLFLDFGSGQYPMLRGIKKFAVLDHHLPAQNSERHANPWFFNIDGSTEISGSGLAFFLSRKFPFSFFSFNLCNLNFYLGNQRERSRPFPTHQLIYPLSHQLLF